MSVCIYHGNCADGFGAAWAVREAARLKGELDQWEFISDVYQQEPPDVAGKNVILVDFSYKADVVARMAKSAKAILILDHHKSAAEDLRPYAAFPFDSSGVHEEWVRRQVSGGVIAHFDMDKSGAMIAWEFFHPGKEPPPLLRHIQDRDLWKFDLEGTREIQAAVFSFPYDFEVWDRLMAMDPKELRKDGVAIERKHFKDIRELLAVCKRRMLIGGYNVPVASLPYTLTSDAGNIMAEGEPFAACYYDSPDGRNFSLRSKEGGVDVSEVAKQFGGGGHKHAAGFKVTFHRAFEFELALAVAA